MELYMKDNQKIIVDYSDYPESPREYDNDFTFLTWSRSLQSPDENDYPTFQDFLESIGTKNPYRMSNNRKYIVFTVSAYIHGGISFRLSHEFRNEFTCPYDSCIIGVMYADKDELKSKLGMKRLSSRMAYNIAYEELYRYQQYANNEVFYVGTYDKNDEGEYELIDSIYDVYDIDDFLKDIGLDINHNHVGCFNTLDEALEYEKT